MSPPPPQPELPPRVADAVGRDSLTTMVVGAAVIAALYFGREILLPVAVAGLLGFALEPLATKLRRWGLGRKVSVVIVVALVLVVVGGIAVVVAQRVYQLADNLPTYQSNIQQKIRALGTTPNTGIFKKATKALQQLDEEITKSEAKLEDSGAPATRPPVLVRIDPATTSSLHTLQSFAAPLIGPAGVVGLVIVFLVCMLLQREDIRDRFIRLVSARNINLTTQALDEAAQRVSRYLVMQLCINATFGLSIGTGLYLLGVPNALLWGLLGTALRFVPYAGAFIAAIFPMVLAVAVDPGWTMVLSTLAMFLAIELIINNVLEPWLYGSSTGLSPVAIIIAVIFWTTLWGPAGLLISTPLTVCLVVLGRYVPQLHFIHVLLGNAPALSPHERFYQRMLAGDTDEGVELAQPYFASGDLAGFHDDIALAALKLAETDRQRGALDQERIRTIATNIESVLRDVADEGVEAAAGATDSEPPVQWEGTPVVCLGGRSALDTAAAALLSDRLNRIGIGARFAHVEEIANNDIKAAIQSAAVVAVVHLSQKGPLHARQLTRRLQKITQASVILCLFNGQHEPAEVDGHPASPPADFIAESPADALSWINIRARSPLVNPMAAPPIPADEQQRLAELARMQLLDTPAEGVFDDIAQEARASVGAPIALISLIDETRQFWKSASGLGEELEAKREAPRETSICGHVVNLGEMVVVEDVLRDSRFANNPFLRENGIRFYAGAPIFTSNGSAIGTLCVMDKQPRQMEKSALAMLRISADLVAKKMIERAAALSGKAREADTSAPVSARALDVPKPA